MEILSALHTLSQMVLSTESSAEALIDYALFDPPRCWFLAISQDVVQNLKDCISPLLSGCFSLEHVGAKLSPF